MNKLKSALRKLAGTKWVSATATPLVAGILTSALTYALRPLGVVSLPADVLAVVTPTAGFVVAAAVQILAGKASPSSAPSVGETIAKMLLDDVAKVIDAEPALARSLAASALERVLHPAQTGFPVQSGAVRLGEQPTVVAPVKSVAPSGQ